MTGSGCQRCGSVEASSSDGFCKDCRPVDAPTLAPTLAPPTEASSPGAPSAANRFTPAAISMPAQFGGYELQEEIARGGMGVVYKARHVQLNRVSALKMILSGRFSSRDELQRFHIEAEAAAGLDHPNIVPVYEIGEVEGQAYFAMKFVEGGSLANHLQRIRQQPKAAVKLLVKVARAVYHAHQRGVLHRDLKPGNILLDKDDEPLITDLGLAEHTAGDSDLTNTGAVVGTPGYMSPEQATGGSITTAADVYALGAILYELLVGEPPFRSDTAIATVMQVINESPTPPSEKLAGVDRDLEAICMKCLERQPEDRYSTALELTNDLEAWLAGEPISVKSPSMVARMSRWFRNNRMLVYISTTILAAVFFMLPFAMAMIDNGKGSLGEVYSRFPSDQTPWLFSIGTAPDWAKITAVLALLFVLWPSIGFITALVVRTKTIWHALGIGVGTCTILVAVSYILLAWLPIAGIATEQSTGKVRVLAEAVWQPPNVNPAEARAEADQLFVGLEDIPENERAAVVADRIAGDQIASAPMVFLVVAIMGGVFCIPIVIGTAIAHVLLKRGNRLWVSFLRYALAWWATIVMIILAMGMLLPQMKLNSRPFGSQLGTVAIVASIAAAIFFLSIRRWRKQNANPVDTKVDTANVVTEIFTPTGD